MHEREVGKEDRCGEWGGEEGREGKGRREVEQVKRKVNYEATLGKEGKGEKVEGERGEKSENYGKGKEKEDKVLKENKRNKQKKM